jgi:hypothetical protein
MPDEQDHITERCPFCGHRVDAPCDSPPAGLCQKASEILLGLHEFDDDAVCIHCGFDGAEWHHWKHNTWEGKAKPDARQPRCTGRRR